MPDQCVLVIDDERVVRDAIHAALGELPIECIPVETGEEGLKRAEDPRVGVALVDVRLSGLSGLEVMRRLQTQRPTLRLIALAGQADQELVLEALRNGACDYLAKPLHEEELRLAVRRALDGFGVATRWQSLRVRLQQLCARCAELVEGVRAYPDETDASLHRRVADSAGQVLKADWAGLWLRGEDPKQLSLVGALGNDVSDDDEHPLDQSVAGLAVDSDGILVIDDIETDPRCAGRRSPVPFAPARMALAPLPSTPGPSGVIGVARPAGDAAFDDTDLALLRLFALQVAARLGRRASSVPSADATPSAVRAPESSDDTQPLDVDPVEGPDGEEADSDAELARSICEAVTAEVDPARLLGGALRAVVRVLDASPAAVYLLDAEAEDLALEAQHSGAGAADRERLPRDRGLTGVVLQTGQLVAADHPERDSRFVAEVDTPEDGAMGPLLCVPLRVRGRVLGVARVFPRRRASARTGEVLAAALSAAIRNVLLYRNLLQSIDDLARARREAEERSPR